MFHGINKLKLTINYTIVLEASSRPSSSPPEFSDSSSLSSSEISASYNIFIFSVTRCFFACSVNVSFCSVTRRFLFFFQLQDLGRIGLQATDKQKPRRTDRQSAGRFIEALRSFLVLQEKVLLPVQQTGKNQAADYC